MTEDKMLELWDKSGGDIYVYADLVADHEREACAKVCEKQMEGKSIWIEGSRACSIAIRARVQE